MLRNLKLWQKLGLLSLAFVIPTLVLVVLLRQEKNLSIDFAEKELAGNQYLGGLKAVLEGLPLYGMSGDTGAAAKVEGGFKALDAVEAQHGALLNTAQRLSTLKDQWQKTTGSASPQDRAARTEQLIQSVVDTFAYVGDSSNLILDPDLDSYYTMEAATRRSACSCWCSSASSGRASTTTAPAWPRPRRRTPAASWRRPAPASRRTPPRRRRSPTA
jgi:methyl-accepting chemotaxis protein